MKEKAKDQDNDNIIKFLHLIQHEYIKILLSCLRVKQLLKEKLINLDADTKMTDIQKRELLQAQLQQIQIHINNIQNKLRELPQKVYLQNLLSKQIENNEKHHSMVKDIEKDLKIPPQILQIILTGLKDDLFNGVMPQPDVILAINQQGVAGEDIAKKIQNYVDAKQPQIQLLLEKQLQQQLPKKEKELKLDKPVTTYDVELKSRILPLMPLIIYGMIYGKKIQEEMNRLKNVQIEQSQKKALLEKQFNKIKADQQLLSNLKNKPLSPLSSPKHKTPAPRK